MNSFIISYDLIGVDKQYDDLINAIKGFQIWANITESTWFVKSSQTSGQIRNMLLELIDSTDRIFVAKLTGEAAWNNPICTTDFLKKHL